MDTISLHKLFENMVSHVVFQRDNEVFEHLNFLGYYSPRSKTLAFAEGLDDETLFYTAYAILLKRLHPEHSIQKCKDLANEACAKVSPADKKWVLDYLENKVSPLKLV